MATGDVKIFNQVFSQITGIDVGKQSESWAASLWNVASRYVNAGVSAEEPYLYDLILSDEKAPQSYKDRFSAVTDLKKKNSKLKLTVADYIQQENQYKNLLTNAGLSDLADETNIKQFFLNEVSYDEAAKRINNAYKAIDNADEYTKSILDQRFGGLSKSDLARGLLTGKEGTDEIEKKVYGAQLLGAAKSAGITSSLTEQQLTSSGLSPTEAKKAFAAVAEQQDGIKQASRIFETRGAQDDIQAELEKQQLGIAPSKRVTGLASQARAEFSGSTGITTGSLSTRKSGQI